MAPQVELAHQTSLRQELKAHLPLEALEVAYQPVEVQSRKAASYTVSRASTISQVK